MEATATENQIQCFYIAFLIYSVKLTLQKLNGTGGVVRTQSLMTLKLYSDRNSRKGKEQMRAQTLNNKTSAGTDRS
jgi:hypothetical protein